MDSTSWRGSWRWKSALLSGLLALIAYYCIFQLLTTTVVIGSIFDRPLFAETVISVIGALAIFRWKFQRRTSEGHERSTILRRHPDLVYLLFLVPFVSLFLFFPSSKVPLLHHGDFDAVRTILVEGGYCGEKKGSDCANTMIDSDSIAGGFQRTVYGVTDKKVLDQLKQAYADAFLKAPAIKHLIVYFDPNPQSKAQSKFKDAFIELRKG